MSIVKKILWISLCLPGIAIAKPSIVVTTYNFLGSYKVNNAILDTPYGNFFVFFSNQDNNFLNPKITLSYKNQTLSYTFGLPPHSKDFHASAKLNLKGLFDVGKKNKDSIKVKCIADVNITGSTLTLSNSHCKVTDFLGKLTASTLGKCTMTFNGQPTASLNTVIDRNFPQLDITYYGL